MTLDQIILKAIPVNSTCAIEEQYNKERRKLLKQRLNDYIAAQLSRQFNARPVIQEPDGNSDEFRLDTGAQ